MKPYIIRLGLATFVCSSLGCAMCCGPYDYDYPSLGGKHQRTDQTYGRVGSILSDPMASPLGGTADSNLKVPEPRTRRDTEENLDKSRELRDNIKRELDEQKPGEEGPEPDSKEAMRQNQRPNVFREWR